MGSQCLWEVFGSAGRGAANFQDPFKWGRVKCELEVISYSGALSSGALADFGFGHVVRVTVPVFLSHLRTTPMPTKSKVTPVLVSKSWDGILKRS